VTEAIKQVDPAADVQADLASKKVSVASSKERTSFAEALTEAGYATA
jgi:copper chaperone